MIMNILGSASPLILAALGGLLTERAGILNIALEGMILSGAFTSLLVTSLSGSPGLGILAALVSGTIVAGIFNFSSFTLKGNPFISGLGINILVPALIASITQKLYGNQGIIRPAQIRALPRPGGLDLFIWIALGVLILLMVLFYRTRSGLIIRSCGDHPDLLKSRGVDPLRVKRLMVLLSGMLCGVSGSAISLRLGVFVPGMSAGKGWIALVAIYLGYRKIPGIALACLFFALAEWGTNRAQGFLGVPPSLILSFPYFLTLAGLLLFSIRRNRTNPSE
jgi:simple sugar transport system permease protein